MPEMSKIPACRGWGDLVFHWFDFANLSIAGLSALSVWISGKRLLLLHLLLLLFWLITNY